MLVITWFSGVTFAASTAAVAGTALATVRAAVVMDTARDALVILGRMICLHFLPAFRGMPCFRGRRATGGAAGQRGGSAPVPGIGCGS